MRRLILVILIALFLNTGHFVRNFHLYGHPLSTATEFLKNETYSAGIVFQNALRNTALHFGTPSPQLNQFTYQMVEMLLGDQLNNPESTFKGTEFSIPFSLHEDLAGNPLHVLLITVAILILPFLSVPDRTTVYSYAGGICLAALLFGALIRWQPWATRLHTPLFMLAVPLVGVVTAKAQSIYRNSHIYLALMVTIYTIPFLLLNTSRPLLPLFNKTSILTAQRQQLYFSNRSDLYNDYTGAIKVILEEDEEHVGLYMQPDDWEYPFWVLANRHAVKAAPHFKHIDVSDISGTLDDQQNFVPTIVVATKDADDNKILGRPYIVIFDSKNVQVWKLNAVSQNQP